MIGKIDCSHSFRCWECSQNCEIKTLFSLPEPMFMCILNDTIKFVGGLLLTKNVPLDIVEKQNAIMVATLVTSRKKFLESKEKHS